MKCALVTTLIESIWNWATRLITAWTSRMPTLRPGRRSPNP